MFLQFFATEEEKKQIYAGTDAQQTTSGTAAPSYAGSYEQQIKELSGQISSRQPFKYNVNEDAAYQQYKDRYMQQGKQAAKNTMGQAAALTGGYGSSYGQAVGQQTYDDYLTKLNDVIPDLYQNAYSRYTAEGDALQQQLQNANALAESEYSKYRDALSQYNTEQQLAYEKQQNSYSQMAALISSSGYEPNAEELAASGMTEAQANALKQAWIVANPLVAYRNGDIDAEGYRGITGEYPVGYTASGGGGGYYVGYSSSDAALQRELNQWIKDTGADIEPLKVDGIAGTKTNAALEAYTNSTNGAAKTAYNNQKLIASRGISAR